MQIFYLPMHNSSPNMLQNISHHQILWDAFKNERGDKQKRGAGHQQTRISVVMSGSGNDIQLMHALFWASLCNIEYNMHDYMYCTEPAIACSITLPSLINSNISKVVECFPQFLFHKSSKQQRKNLIIEDTPNKNTPAIHTGLVQNHLIST